MKKIFSIILLACSCFILEARKIYVTRHAQVGDKNMVHLASREWMITPLGKKQAELLADYLVNVKKFNGTIFVSPFYRTIETGLITAGKLNKKVILEPGIQEIAPNGKGKFLKRIQIDEYFQGKAVYGSAFNNNWRLSHEDNAARQKRVDEAIERILKETAGDILLVSHGGTCSNIVRTFNTKAASGVKPVKGMPWNCALFTFELDADGKVTSASYTTEYMTDDIVTNNFRTPKVAKPDDQRYEKTKKKK